MTTTDDRAVRAVVVLGGDRADRSRAVAELVQGATSRRGRTEPDRVLVLTCGHDELDPRTGTSADGRVELRRLEPTRLVGAYLAGASDPQDEVLAALASRRDIEDALVREHVHWALHRHGADTPALTAAATD